MAKMLGLIEQLHVKLLAMNIYRMYSAKLSAKLSSAELLWSEVRDNTEELY